MQLLTISDTAQSLGVSLDTIRRWEKKGLIKAHRNATNHRLFNVQEVQRVVNQANRDHSAREFTVLKAEATGLTSIDLFAGGGGTALGLENAGFQHLLLSEFDKHACQTLRHNRPEWNVIEGDVAHIDFTPYRGQVDVLEGGFPCQAFSYAGKGRGFEDTRGTLFYQFARAVSETMPKVAVGENVKGLIKHDGGRTLATMISTLQHIRDENGIGYKVAWKLLRSQYLDVAQKRERLVIIAVRDDVFSGSILFPKERDYIISLREAIGDVPAGPGQEYSKRKREILELVPPGGYWRDLPEALQREYLKGSYHLTGGKTGMARRLSWDEPSLTLTCAPAQKQTERCHPEQTRPLNVREYARIQSFPDSWEFPVSVNAAYKQIGNAVPVNLGYHIGMAVRAMIERTSEAEFDALAALQGDTLRQEF